MKKLPYEEKSRAQKKRLNRNTIYASMESDYEKRTDEKMENARKWFKAPAYGTGQPARKGSDDEC